MQQKQMLSMILILMTAAVLYGQQSERNEGLKISAGTQKKPVRILTQSDYCPEQNDPKGINDSLSDYEFMFKYYKTIESSLNRNRKVGKLGRRTIEGIQSGTFYYRCKLTGWNKVLITMTYQDYCDDQFILNGTTFVEVNWKAAGIMTGEIYASGPGQGKIRYNLELTDGVENAGHYFVERPDNGFVLKVPSELVLTFAERDIELDEKCTAGQ